MSTSKGLTEIGQDGFARSRMLEGKWMTDSNNEFVRYLGQFFWFLLWNFVCRNVGRVGFAVLIVS